METVCNSSQVRPASSRTSSSRSPRIYTPGIARDHGYRIDVLGEERFAGASVRYADATQGSLSGPVRHSRGRQLRLVDDDHG